MSICFEALDSVSLRTITPSLSSSTTIGSMVMPVANFTSCSTCSFDGSDMPMKTRLPRLPSGMMRRLVTIFASMRARGELLHVHGVQVEQRIAEGVRAKSETSFAESFFERTSCWMKLTPDLAASAWIALASAWTSLPCCTSARPRALKWEG
jgi:hypothetical protein